VGIIEEFYYFSKNKGSLNAGAFETLLKQFADINNTNSPRLVLADEIESVTEPSVAAKIIEGIINHLSIQEKTLMVLVTHMGNELAEQSVSCRFDGIEAKGLDNDLNLVVDRNPIIGRLARSTPQLIVERLAKKENNVFYTNLHKSLTSN
jgi:dsDNA-specific endonuclease/ATPase MutS2